MPTPATAMRILCCFLWILLSIPLTLTYTRAAGAEAYTNYTASAADISLSGRVVSRDTREAVPFASVFLAGTLSGGVTDENGYFELTGLPQGSFELVVSHIGYITYRQTIDLQAGKTTLDISLESDINSLGEVVVTSKKDRKWQQRYKQFERSLLGTTANAKGCTIDNLWVVSFAKDKKYTLATASAPIEVTNQNLGYKLSFYLHSFRMNKKEAVYVGDTRFEPLQAKSNEEQKQWERNRQQTYNGSLRHFMRSLLEGTHEQEGFLAYHVLREPYVSISHPHVYLKNEQEHNLQMVLPDSIFRVQPHGQAIQMQFAGKMAMMYTKENAADSPYKDAPYQVSYLKTNDSLPLLTSTGWLLNPTSLSLGGHLAKEGVADMLPFEYEPIPEEMLSGDSTLISLRLNMKQVINRFEQSVSENMSQKVYLHHDRPQYIGGDTLWLSAYMVDAAMHELYAANSQVLYVELISPVGKLVSRQKLAALQGRTSGFIALPDTLSGGNYALVAYTNWMRNFDTEYFFSKTLPIYSKYEKRVSAPLTGKHLQDSLHVSFFPEGGHLVTGISSRLAFKAIGRDGKGVAVRGSIVDEEGKEAAPFESNALGMGSTLFTPEKGRKYTALCKMGEQAVAYALPEALPEGPVMTVAQIALSKLLVNVAASPAYQSQRFFCVAQTRGIIYYSVSGQMRKEGVFFEIPTFKIPDGICQITLFSAAGVPLCERLVFVQSPAKKYQVEIQTEEKQYAPGEKVEMALQLQDSSGEPLPVSYSVSVTDAANVQYDSLSSNIYSYLLLSSDLKGEIEKPGYYFLNQEASTIEALDVLMLTQGWRRFSWQQLMAEKEPNQMKYKPEEGLVLSGRVVMADMPEKPLPYSRLTLVPTDASSARVHTATADAGGRFVFSSLHYREGYKALFKISDSLGYKLRAKVLLDIEDNRLPAIPVQVMTQLVGSNAPRPVDDFEKKLREQLVSDIAGDKLLDEVVVKAKKKRPAPIPNPDPNPSVLYSIPDVVLKLDDRHRGYSNIYQVLQSRVAGVSADPGSKTITIRSMMPNIPPLIIVDGTPLGERDNSALDMVNPADVERIEVLKTVASAAAYGIRGGGGVIAIYTRMGSPATPPSTEGAVYTLTGYSPSREFYVPRYEVALPAKPSPYLDKRVTLYWNPVVEPEEGKATFSFYNSAKAQKFLVVMEGMTAAGQPFVYRKVIGND